MKKIFLRTAAAFAAAVLLFPPVTAGAISAEHAIVMDANSGRVLYEKAAAEKASAPSIVDEILSYLFAA